MGPGLGWHRALLADRRGDCTQRVDIGLYWLLGKTAWEELPLEYSKSCLLEADNVQTVFERYKSGRIETPRRFLRASAPPERARVIGGETTSASLLLRIHLKIILYLG